MPESDNNRTTTVDARKLALEAMATLVNVKKIAADRLLRPAGIPDTLIRHFLKGRDETTGDALTKRQAGALILDELAKEGKDGAAVRSLLKMAADWTAYDLAQDEYKARAVVQKARELVGVLAEADEREKAEHDKATQGRAEQHKLEQESMQRRETALLLAQFDQASVDGGDPQARGYLLQDLLDRLFIIHGITVTRSFQRNSGAEQIDGAFELDGWHYIVECRWRAKLANIRELDGLYGQIGRSGKQTMGLFLSINGWSENVVSVIKQNPDKCIVLMEGYDLRTVLAQPLDLRRLLKAKIRALNLEAEPYFSVSRL
jgi:hypothetical protein